MAWCVEGAKDLCLGCQAASCKLESRDWESALCAEVTELHHVRETVDRLATEVSRWKLGGPRPDLQGFDALVLKLQGLLRALDARHRPEAHFILGSLLFMLGEGAALEALAKAVEAPVGALSLSDHVTAVLLLLPGLKDQQRWEEVAECCNKARDACGGSWVQPTLPFMLGVALARIGRTEDAAESLEVAVKMNPGMRNACNEFDSVVAGFGDFERARRVAQRVVDHGGHWINCWQRPPHFLRDPAITGGVRLKPKIYRANKNMIAVETM